MNFLSILIFSIAISIDNISLGLICGIKKLKLSLQYQILIIFITSITTLLSIILGDYIHHFLSNRIANIIGFIILFIIGILTIISHFKSKQSEIKINDLDYKKIVLISLVLSLNNLGIGIGFSVQGFNVFYTIITNIIIGYLLLVTGFYIGNKSKSIFIQKYELLISGGLIIILAFLQFLI